MKTSKWFKTIIFVFCCVGVASLAWSIDIESFVKVDGVDKGKIVQGVITKIEGNKITLKDQTGKLMTVGVKGALQDVKGESRDDKYKDERQRIRAFKVGDKVKIEGGKLMKMSTDSKKP